MPAYPRDIGLDAESLAALETVQVIPRTSAGTELFTAATPGSVESWLDGDAGGAAGTATGTVTVPAGARVCRVEILANASAPTTVDVAGLFTVTVPAGAAWDHDIAGKAPLGADVVIGGAAPQTYVVAWVVEA